VGFGIEELPLTLLHQVARQPTLGTLSSSSSWLGVAVNSSLDNQQGADMDWNRVEGNWKQVKGKVKEKWGKLTDDDLATINGKRDQLEGKIQERYGIAKDQVKKDVDDWFSTQSW
jgi:uncharacterized protein YjbJ (UPF0337 family)